MRYKSSGCSNFSTVVMGGVSAKKSFELLQYEKRVSPKRPKPSTGRKRHNLRVRVNAANLRCGLDGPPDLRTLGPCNGDIEGAQIFVQLCDGGSARDGDDGPRLSHLPCEDQLWQNAAFTISKDLGVLGELRVGGPVGRRETWSADPRPECRSRY